MYILDSSLLIEIIQKKSRAEKIMKVIGNDAAATTSVSVHELFRGADEKEEFVIKGLLQGMEIFSFTAEDAQTSGKLSQKLVKKGTSINIADLFIAGICLSHDATLITLDNDFERVPELKKIIV